MTTYIFGCRDPASRGIGKWDGAFMYGGPISTLEALEALEASEDVLVYQTPEEYDNIFQVTVLFQDNKDWIGHPAFEDARDEYASKIADGWTPMTSEDIFETGGVECFPCVPRVPCQE